MNINQFCRKLILKQTEAYKRKNIRIDQCEQCGRPMNLLERTVEHVIPFAALVAAFVEIHGMPDLTKLVSDRWKKAWQDFHREHARYKIFCVHCNRKENETRNPLSPNTSNSVPKNSPKHKVRVNPAGSN